MRQGAEHAAIGSAVVGGPRSAGDAAAVVASALADAEEERSLADWRGAVLGPLLRGAAATHIAGAVAVLVVADARFRSVALAGLCLGVYAVGLLRVPSLGTQRRGWAFIVGLCALQSYIGVELGLTPIPTVLASVNVCVSTLLLGRSGLLLVLLVHCATYLGGAWGATQWDVPHFPAHAHPATASAWLTIVFTVVLAGLALIDAVRQVLRNVLAWFDSAGDQSRQTSDAVVETQALRARAARARRALAESQRLQALHHLGQGMAHRFNNILTAMAGAVDTLRHSLSATERQEVLRELQAATEAATASTRDLLVIGRREASPTGPIDLRESVSEAQASWARLVRPDLRLEVVLDETPPVALQPQQLRQLLTNLLLNAMDATPAGGVVRVTTGRQRVAPPEAGRSVGPGLGTVDALPPGDYAFLAVADSGPGLSAEVQARAFEPFFTTRSRDSHDGLGLSVARGIARLAGGSIAFRPPPDTATPGAHVVVYLPSQSDPLVLAGLVERDAAPQPLPAPAPPPPRESRATPRALTADLGPPDPERRISAEFPAVLLPLESDPEKLGAWRIGFLDRAVLHAMGLFVTLLVIRAATASAEHAESLWVSLALCVCASCFLPSRVPLAPKLTGLVVLGAVAGVLLIALSGAFGAESYPLLFASICWAAASARRRTVNALLFCICLCLLTIAALRLRGVLPYDNAQARPDVTLNWLRAGALAAPALVVLGWTIDSLLSFASSGRRRLEAARQALRDALVAREAEDRLATESQEALARSNRLEVSGRVVGGVAHDLNNVLQVVACAVPLLEQAGPAESRELLDELDAAIGRAQHLVAPLGQPVTGERRSAPLPAEDGPSTELYAHVRGATASFARSLPGGVRLRVTPGSCPDGVWARIEPVDFDRVLLNLLANARDAVGVAGTIEVRVVADAAAPAGGRAVVEVQDDGAGIPAELQPRIFEPLFTTKATGAGTGLGLYQSRLIIQAGGGQLGFTSQPGQTRFTVTLPLRSAQPQAPLPPRRTVSQPTTGMRVLMVDDEPLVRRALARGLRRAGFVVEEAADAAEAMARLRDDGPFDALCSDAVMPGPPVGELVRRFAGQYPEAPIVVCSGNLPDALPTELASVDRVSFVHKPVRADALARQLLGEALPGRILEPPPTLRN